jgi:hypothetical protein
MLPIKKILFPSSFWGIFDFFVFFNNFGKRIKECYVTKENRVSQTYDFPVHGTQGCSGQRDICKKRALGKTPLGVKGVKTQRKNATGLAYKACFKWFS